MEWEMVDLADLEVPVDMVIMALEWAALGCRHLRRPAKIDTADRVMDEDAAVAA